MGSSPTPTARTTPTGNILEHGYQTLITIAADADIDFWEKTVTPPGVEGGDAIDITTMHNSNVITKDAQALYEWTDSTSVVAYDRAVYTQIVAVVNVNSTITWTFPDGGTVAAYGFLKSFIPSDMSRDSQPEATVTFVVTNVDPSDGTEQLPAVTASVGTP